MNSLTHEIKNSMDFLNFISNVGEHNLEFVEQLGITMLRNLLRNLDQHGCRVGLELLLSLPLNTNWSPNRLFRRNGTTRIHLGNSNSGTRLDEYMQLAELCSSSSGIVEAVRL